MAVDATGPLIIGITVMFEVIAIVAVALRFWSKRVLKRKFFAHDIWIMIGFVKFIDSRPGAGGVLTVM
jgi:hypothetical protein